MTRVALALVLSVAAVMFLLVGIGYPFTEDQRFLRQVSGPPLVIIHAWTQIVVGVGLSFAAVVCWFRAFRRA